MLAPAKLGSAFNRDIFNALSDARYAEIKRKFMLDFVCAEIYRENRAAVAEAVKKRRDNSRLYVRVPDNAIESVLLDGRLKSQFETGTSRGLLDADNEGDRRIMENKFFGYSMDTAPQDRPIYGYMSDCGGMEESVDQYGENIVVLRKNAVRNRTTITYRDSLNYVGYDQTKVARLFDDVDESIVAINDYKKEPDSKCLYYEAQFHGGVFLNDIEWIIFRDAPFVSRSGKRGWFHYAKAPRLESILMRRGINYSGLAVKNGMIPELRRAA